MKTHGFLPSSINWLRITSISGMRDISSEVRKPEQRSSLLSIQEPLIHKQAILHVV